MKNAFRFIVAIAMVTVIQLNSVQPVSACGPSVLTPVFNYSYAPERPWTDFASGKLGIIKPTYRRAVLYAAYRYLNGSGFGQDEQKALIEMWEMHFNRRLPGENETDWEIADWIKARKAFVTEKEPLPQIYADKAAGEDSYNTFQNCSANAFVVAKKTLESRALEHGSDSKEVKEWIAGQDKVFATCNGGSETPAALGPESPEWLRKDRDYQIAAAVFYTSDYEQARIKFQAIAADGQSPWRELADYLVARTLIREASLGGDDAVPVEGAETALANEKARYQRAEDYLINLTGRATTYNADAQSLMNLVKYRLHPEQRVRELAQKLARPGDRSELRQDLIDYTWLLNEFESKALITEENRKAAEEKAKNPEAAQKAVEATRNASEAANEALRSAINAATKESERIDANFTANSAVNVAPAAPASLSTQPETYYGSEQLSMAILPEFLGQDDLTEWLFVYQINDDPSYFYSMDRWRQTGSDIWLMTALTKAKKNLAGVKELLDAGERIGTDSAAFYTIAYHRVRLLTETGKTAEARKLLENLLNSPLDMPVSTRNMFADQALKMSQTLPEFLLCSIRKPFGFSYEDDTAYSIDQIIAERKTWYSAEYDTVPQTEYDAEIEKEFADKRQWEQRGFLDDESVSIINTHFPTSLMMELLTKPEFPDYLKRRLTIAIWTRSFLTKDEKTALAIAPEIVKLKSETDKLMAAYVAAKTPAEREKAGLYLIVKTGEMTPYLYSGFDTELQDDDDMWQDDRWWCEQYNYTYDDDGNERPKAVFMPPFITGEMAVKSKAQSAALKATGDGLTYLSDRVMEWAKTRTAAADPRLPEALYLIFHANRWVKYSCGGYRAEIRQEAAQILKTRFPRSKWTSLAMAELAEGDN